MAPNPMKPVTHLDIDRYMGRWYEIAKYPARFQPKDGVNTRANYALNEDGTVKVVNETWVDGKRRFIEGNAYKVDSESEEAKLKVKFYVPPFLPVIPVVGDYWVLYIDEGYRYALVGQPSAGIVSGSCAEKTIWTMRSIIRCWRRPLKKDMLEISQDHAVVESCHSVDGDKPSCWYKLNSSPKLNGFMIRMKNPKPYCGKERC